MWTAIRHHSSAAIATLIASLIFMAVPSRLFAVDSSVPQSVNLAQPTETPPPTQDRKEGAGGAIAAAAVGAAMAGMGCAMMMDAARKEEDLTQKRMMMAMAMQQCAQAAANLANMGDNKKAKDALTTPKEPTLQSTAATPTPKPSSDDFKLPEQAAETPVVVAETPAAAPETNSGVVAPSAFDKKAVGIPTKEIKLAAAGVSSSIPKLVPDPKVGFDDNAKPGETTLGGSSQSTFGGTGTGGPAGAASAASKDLKKLLAKEDSLLTATGKSGGKGETHGTGASDEGKSEKGSDGMADMLAQLMGGGAPLPASDLVSNQVFNLKEFAKPGGGEPTEDLPNIFQYASYRYRQLGQEVAVGIRKNRTPGVLTAKRDPAILSRSPGGRR